MGPEWAMLALATWVGWPWAMGWGRSLALLHSTVWHGRKGGALRRDGAVQAGARGL